MSNIKEPGQIAFEVYSRLRFGSMPWREIGEQSKKSFAAVEAAVRAAALEEAAMVVDGFALPNRFKVSDEWKEYTPCEVYETAAVDVSLWAADAIRALSPSPAAPLNPSASSQSATPPAAGDQG